MNVIIRPANSSDLTDLQPMMLAMLADMAAAGGDPLAPGDRSPRWVARHLADALDDPQALLLAAEVGEGARSRRAGFAEASLTQLHPVFHPLRLLHIHAVYVLPGYRRQGIASALLEAALRWGQEQGCQGAELNVLAGNPARWLYEKLGFSVFETAMRRQLPPVYDRHSAIDFIRRQGGAVELARLETMLAGTAAPESAVSNLFAGQRPDGGCSPFWAPQYSSIDATCYRLAQCEQLRIDFDGQQVRQALDFLASRQHPDGSWEEEPGIADQAPPWAAPGDLAARLYLSANAAFWLAYANPAGEPALRGAAFVKKHLAEDGRLPSFLHAHWLAAGLWVRLGQLEPAESVLGYLETRLPQLEASNLGWMLNALRIAGADRQMLLVQAAARRLAILQQPGGRWISEDSPQQDVHATLEALRALEWSTTPHP